MELYFLRHGDAVTGESWKGKDGKRPLSAPGAALMEREAAAIARLCGRVDVILCSPSLRARQTAEIVVRKLGRRELLEVEERLSPGFGVDELAAILRERHGAGALLLVGHEPDFSKMIGQLIGGGDVEMKKAAVARVDCNDISPGSGVLQWLVTPKLLGA